MGKKFQSTIYSLSRNFKGEIKVEELLVSIIVPVYNVEQYIDKCIRSILCQSYHNLEIIIIDDGSTDKSGYICDEFARQDERIIVYHQENKGVSFSRNIALDICKGDWILFVDSDDCINKSTVQECMAFIFERPELDIIHFDYQNIAEDRNINFSEDLRPNTKYTKNNTEAILQCFNESGDIVVWNKMYKKVLFKQMRFPIGKIHEDEFITYKLLYKANVVGYLDCPLYYYRIRKKSIMRSDFNREKMVLIDAFEERIDFFKKNNELQLTEISIMQYYNILRTLYTTMNCVSEEYKEERLKIRNIILKNRTLFLSNHYLSLGHKIILWMLKFSDKVLNIYYLKSKMKWGKLR